RSTKKKKPQFSNTRCEITIDDPDQVWINSHAQCSAPGALESIDLSFLFTRPGELNSPDPVHREFPIQSSKVVESSHVSQSSQSSPVESEVAPSKLQAMSQYYLQAVARRCSALLNVPDFMKNSISLQEDLQEEDNFQATLGVYEIAVDEDCPDNNPEPENEEDPAEQYASGIKRFDEPTSAIEEPTKEINLGTEDDPKAVLISANLSPEEEAALVDVLKEYRDSFAWTYEDMPGLDSNLVEHHLPLKPGAKPVKQK